MRSLSAPDNDINFEIVTELQEVRQRIRQRLRFFRGEWFLNAEEGVPYLSDLLGDRLDIGLVESVIRNQILAVEDVTGVSNVTVTESHRVFRFGATVSTLFGSMELEDDVPGLN